MYTSATTVINALTEAFIDVTAVRIRANDDGTSELKVYGNGPDAHVTMAWTYDDVMDTVTVSKLVRHAFGLTGSMTRQQCLDLSERMSPVKYPSKRTPKVSRRETRG